jgi:hypothetical protein
MNSDRDINWLRVFEVAMHVALLVGLTAAAARVSYSALQESAEGSHVQYPQLWAGLLDGAAVSLALIVWSLRRRGERAPGARLLLYGSTALSTALQVSAAPPAWRDQIIHAVPPLLVLALFEQILRVIGRPTEAPAPLPARVRAWWSTTAGAPEAPALPAGNPARPELSASETRRALGPARDRAAREGTANTPGATAGSVPARRASGAPGAAQAGPAAGCPAEPVPARPVAVEVDTSGTAVPDERAQATAADREPARLARAVAAQVERVGMSVPVERQAGDPQVPARLVAVGEAVRRLEAEGREVTGAAVAELLEVEASNGRKKLRAYRQALAEAEGVPA